MYTCHYIIIVIKSLLLQGYEKWALAHLPGQVWKLLGGVQTLHFLMHLLKTLEACQNLVFIPVVLRLHLDIMLFL